MLAHTQSTRKKFLSFGSLGVNRKAALFSSPAETSKKSEVRGCLWNPLQRQT